MCAFTDSFNNYRDVAGEGDRERERARARERERKREREREYERRSHDLSLELLFITTVPITKLFAWGEGE